MNRKSFFSSRCVLTFFFLLLCAGCASNSPHTFIPGPENAVPSPSITLVEGDALKIVFAGGPALNTDQVIRRDGLIALPTLGEVKASGLTPEELEKEIIKKFGDQLVTKEVTVTIAASVYGVYVSGAVVHPGKIPSVRPLTALDAIMESGGFDFVRANLKSVLIIRTEGSETKTFRLDFRPLMKGQPIPPFYLKPSDIIYVPERFTVF